MFLGAPGTLTQDGNSATCMLDGDSIDDLESALAFTIAVECGIKTGVSINTQECSLKRKGDGVAINFETDGVATPPGQIRRSGKRTPRRRPLC